MKANAPEKIYISPAGILYKGDKQQNDDIEYVRKDAFIEKALTYLNSKFYFHNAFYGVVSTDFSTMEELFEDFKNYMKGE